MKKKILKILSKLLNKVVALLNRLSIDDQITITSISYNESGRFLLYFLNNDKLKAHKEVLRSIFYTLMNNKEFIEFGSKKVILVSAKINGEDFSFHHNVLISNNSTFEEYYDKVKDSIITNYEDGYPVDVIPVFLVRVWNMDEFVNKTIKITKDATRKDSKVGWQNKVSVESKFGWNNISKRNFTNHIKPIKATKITDTITDFATMDIETINFNGNQIPIAISTTYNLSESKLFLIDSVLFTSEPSTAINNLWKDYIDFISLNPGLFRTIFVLNLGSFDGLFLYKALTNFYTSNPEIVNTIIDDKNKFIQITLTLEGNTIVWKDSYRIFPVSLEGLCKVFKVTGKVSKYDQRFNSIELFDNLELLKDFKEYSTQDSICLFEALKEAQIIYSREYSVDITSVLSNASLSLKIFRQQFLNCDIPILKGTQDSFIRRGYFGGATDYYKAYGENLKYYDVNSLYPHAMLKPMPHEVIKFHNDLSNIELKDFFGFCLAEITTPKNMLIPLLPYKHNGKTIFPTGTWIGVYFSEELKEVATEGYSVKLLKGYEFSKSDLFTSYVEHFYEIKKNSSGPERWIAKMHLNGLYGIFGRKKDLIQTINVKNEDLYEYTASKIIKNIITINDDISTILIMNNVNRTILKKLNSSLETNITSSFVEVKSNVAIAAAVTSYARIEMIRLKVLCLKFGINILYTDTDSIFTDKPLPNNLIGRNLGELKDELNGVTISEAYFLGIKQYGYHYTDSNNRVEQSVFAGVTRNSITFKEIVELFNGGIISKHIPVRFFKSFENLSVTIKSTKVSITMNADKKLVNNEYVPINIFNLNHKLDTRSLFIKLKSRIIKMLKHFF